MVDNMLANRRCLVTGASLGVGSELARGLAAAGARVALLSRRKEPLEELARELPGSVALSADVGTPSEVEAAVSQAVEILGGLDVVINNAGTSRHGPFAEQEPADWNAVIATNLLGPMHVLHYALPALQLSEAADVVFISSMSAHRVVDASSSIYAATKAGLNAWTDGLRRELGPQGIRVMTVTPGLVATTFGIVAEDAAARDEILRQRVEAGLAPCDVANQVFHLLSQPRHIRIHELAIMPVAQQN